MDYRHTEDFARYHESAAARARYLRQQAASAFWHRLASGVTTAARAAWHHLRRATHRKPFQPEA